MAETVAVCEYPVNAASVKVWSLLDCQICGDFMREQAAIVCRRCGTVCCHNCRGEVDPDLCAACDEEESRDLFLEMARAFYPVPSVVYAP